MTISIRNLVTVILLFGVLQMLESQPAGKLPRSTPEAEGVSSEGIIDFLNAVDTGSVELHSYMFIRHGKVIAEGWWAPYGPDYKHLLYSASKTFTATAIGLAISEGRLKVTDKIISFFPYSLPDTISEYMKEMTVGNLLSMSVGQDPQPRSMGSTGDWVRTFIGTAPLQKPGTTFKYNNMATFMQSAIIQQVTGETLFEYLKPRIFEPLGIRGMDWDLNPQGINLGMIGLRLKTEDLGKFGQLLLQGGKWNRQQLIPSSWVADATSIKIETAGQDNKLPVELNDWAQGYCYQMWRGRNNTVRIDGMGGQFVVLLPDRDAVVVFTANAKNTQHELNLMHDYLIPAIKSDKPLAPANNSLAELQKRQLTLSLQSDKSEMAAPALASRISGKEFLLDNNEYGIQSIYLILRNGECSFGLRRDNRITTIRAGQGRWIMSDAPSTSLLNKPAPAPSRSVDANYLIPVTYFRSGALYSWTNENTLELIARFVEESLGEQALLFSFTETGGSIHVTIEPKSPVGRMIPGFTPPQIRLRGTMIDLN